jgi:type IV pilus assembly protein PilC
MAQQKLTNMGVSIFCENMAMMLEAGMGPDEAAGLLGKDSGADSELAPAAQELCRRMLSGSTFSAALHGCPLFPGYVAQMVQAGETAGRTPQVLYTLSVYYAGQDRLERRLKSAVRYPAALLLLMTVILLFLVCRLLPVFNGVYDSLSGGLAASSFAYTAFSTGVGWAALAVTAVLAALLLAGTGAMHTGMGRARLMRLAEKLPVTAPVSRQLALARFMQVVSVFVSSGVDENGAVRAAVELVNNGSVRKKVEALQKKQREGKSFATAAYEVSLLEPLYGRMLLSGARSGQTDQVLVRLAEQIDADANQQLDDLTDAIEPALSAFLTVAVGVTLMAAMLPLVGILGAIG